MSSNSKPFIVSRRFWYCHNAKWLGDPRKAFSSLSPSPSLFSLLSLPSLFSLQSSIEPPTPLALSLFASPLVVPVHYGYCLSLPCTPHWCHCTFRMIHARLLPLVTLRRTSPLPHCCSLQSCHAETRLRPTAARLASGSPMWLASPCSLLAMEPFLQDPLRVPADGRRASAKSRRKRER